ncbi:MAG: hypothetical protein M0Z42_25545 [Actinomycetota bacterium]|jgi:hypothetical protein|nr:hypothetical protein [Actinomycetota bacterium]
MDQLPDDERALAAVMVRRYADFALHCLNTQGRFEPIAIFVRGGCERAIALLAFDSDDAKQRCYEGVAELAALMAAEMVVLANDAFMSVAAPGGESATRLPSEDPAAQNCLVVTVVGRWVGGSVLLPYRVLDDGLAAFDFEAAKGMSTSLPWWSASAIRALRDETPRAVADDDEIAAATERWAPEIAAVVAFD